jgi:hypothetical protein
MGTFVGNLHVRTNDAQALETILDELGARNRRVTDARNGWVSVYEERCSMQDEETIESLTRDLSARAKAPAIGFLLHDSDVLRYWLYDSGEEKDTFDSWPGYGEDEDEGPEPEGGDSDALLAYCVAGTTTDAIDAALAEDSTFADDKLSAVAGFLGIDTERALDDFRNEGGGDSAAALGDLAAGGGAALFDKLNKVFAVPPGATESAKELVAAATKGDVDAVRACLARGDDVNGLGMAPFPTRGLSLPGMKLPDIATTPVHAAILARKGDVLDVLLAAGAALDRESPPHFGTALHTAAGMGDPVLVKKLLDAGANPKAPRAVNGATPLSELQTIRRTYAGMEAMLSLLPPEARKAMPSKEAYEECERLLVAAGG